MTQRDIEGDGRIIIMIIIIWIATAVLVYVGLAPTTLVSQRICSGPRICSGGTNMLAGLFRFL